MGPPVPSDYPEFDPILLKCIAYLQMGGKDSRRNAKELFHELGKTEDKSDAAHSRGSSPIVTVPSKVDKRKGGQLDKDSIKKARLEAGSSVDALPRFTNKPGIINDPCSICLKNTNAAKDQLIECNDCHNGYHQKCHDPEIPETVIQERHADPRYVWQCKDCLSMISTISTKKKSDTQKSEKTLVNEPFKRQDKLQNIKSRSREGSPSMTGWGSLLEKDSIDKRDQKNRKKEKKLQQIDMFGNNDSDNSATGSKKKSGKEVNPSAIKALKDKTSRKAKEEEKSKKSVKTNEMKVDEAQKKLSNMKKKSAELKKLKAAAKRL